MPFIGPDPADASLWRQITTVDLRQLPVTRRWKVLFEVIREFGYTELPADVGTPQSPAWSAGTVQHLVPRGMETDLASVPPFLWGVIASYGRQTLPALLHDRLCWAAQLPDQPAPYRRRARREADDQFRRTLRASGSGPLRRWLMWAAVRVFGRPPVLAPFALLVVGAIALLVAGPGWVPALVAIAVGAVGVLVLTLAGAVEQERVPVLAAPGALVPAADEFGPRRLVPRAVGGLLGAVLVSLVAALPIAVLGVATLVAELVVGLGEHTTSAADSRRAGPAKPDGSPGATARIQWRPLVDEDASTVNANPGPGDL
ncbi:DUF1353 domain-containing protein [Cellulomonas soli]|uniref:DUF1353 domain-containing protein n=1 Tax=Cellulomonas soli TaxID=931535 RepID=A0A512PCD8_9CELL|nr:DUF1353 domain-containing protein [Cellulomonas soli]NYI58404.1 hypothetical protein [Cellulomonas soli]GEP68826.1 hypothetical protein CSO01_15410 [Cellulomonas soli]